MNKDDLQTLIDLPSGEPLLYKVEMGYRSLKAKQACTTSELSAIATELRDRREYCKYIDGVGYDHGPFEAWKNAKEAGKL